MAVGRFGPASVTFLVDGFNLLAMKVTSLRVKHISPTTESTGLGDADEEHTPIGVTKTELSQDGGFFDTTASTGSHAAFNAIPTTPQATARVLCHGMAGAAAGYPFDGIVGSFSHEYEVIAAQGDLQRANASYLVTGARERGQILHGLAAQTADFDTESGSADYTLDTSQQFVPITSSSVANPSVITTTVPHGLTTGDKVLIAGHSGSTPSIDGTEAVTVTSTTTFTIVQNVTVGGTGGTIVKADSANGGSGYLQVTAASGFTNFVGKVRDSADDVTYADLLTFADNVSAPFAERVTVAGTVDRYTAFDGNVTGSGSITVFAGFSRS